MNTRQQDHSAGGQSWFESQAKPKIS